jgi:hypothetical protein
MSKFNLSDDVTAFLAKGGAIQMVDAGIQTGAVREAYRAHRAMERGEKVFDYAEYSMRRAEGANETDAERLAWR